MPSRWRVRVLVGLGCSWIAAAVAAIPSGAAGVDAHGQACAWDQCIEFPPGTLATYSFGNAFSFLSASTEAAADYGSLHVGGKFYVGNSTWPFTQPGVGPLGFATQASFEDQLTASGASGAGSARITFRVLRTVQSGCDTVQPCISDLPFLHAISTVHGSGGSFAGGPVAEIILHTGSLDPVEADDFTDITTDPIPFTFGQPFSVDAALAVSLHPDAPGTFDPLVFYNSQGVLTADVVLRSIELADGKGNAVPGATLSAASGTVYPVSEPDPAAAFAALALAAAAIQGFVWRRRSPALPLCVKSTLPRRCARKIRPRTS